MFFVYVVSESEYFPESRGIMRCDLRGGNEEIILPAARGRNIAGLTISYEEER